MKALIVGSGGVGESTMAIAKRRDPDGELFETTVPSGYDLGKAQAFACDDFVTMQKENGIPGGMLEMDSEYKRALDHAGFVGPVEGAGA